MRSVSLGELHITRHIAKPMMRAVLWAMLAALAAAFAPTIAPRTAPEVRSAARVGRPTVAMMGQRLSAARCVRRAGCSAPTARASRL